MKQPGLLGPVPAGAVSGANPLLEGGPPSYGPRKVFSESRTAHLSVDGCKFSCGGLSTAQLVAPSQFVVVGGCYCAVYFASMTCLFPPLCQASKERQMVGSSSNWAPSVVIEGRVVRKMGSLTSTDGQTARFAQMYVHDEMFAAHTGESVEAPTVSSTAGGTRVILPARATRPERARVVALFDEIYAYVRAVNVHVHSFVCAAEELQNMDEDDIQHTVLMLQGKRTAEQQRQSQQQQSRLAGRSPFACNAGEHGRLRGLSEMCVLCDRVLAEGEKSVIVLNHRRLGLQHIPLEHRLYDVLYHVLFHPTGEGQWEEGLRLRRRRDAYASLPAWVIRTRHANSRGSSAMNPRENMSMRQYYAYRLHFRRGMTRSDNCWFMSDRLFQEYACVAFWRIESCRLHYHRMKQQAKRAARVPDLVQYAQQVTQGNVPTPIGRVSYIPESFVGGPTDMHAKYLDAMAAVLQFGAPTLFVTMTANPRWKEVRDSLAYAQTAEQRCDVIARVFHAKLNSMLSDLKNKLGKQVVCVHVIEFQKRGLPHAHIVVILAQHDRPRTPDQVDSLSSAEIPPLPSDDDHSDAANAQRRLRALVLEHMVHNDCSGPGGRSCPCWDDVAGRCGGNFPFDFSSSTSLGDERQRAKYRRRNGAPWTASVQGRHVTNQWVVPYCACLLMRYECHLNVEVVTAAHAVKYLFKYLFKGADSVSAAQHAMNRVPDRIGDYQDHRYLGSSEAMWRLLEFALHRSVARLPEQSHEIEPKTLNVERIAVEIPEERYVVP